MFKVEIDNIYNILKSKVKVPIILDQPLTTTNLPIITINTVKSIQLNQKWFYKININYYYNKIDYDKNILQSIIETSKNLHMDRSKFTKLDFKKIVRCQVFIMSKGFNIVEKMCLK